jgi:hypothetical protein
MLRNPPVADPIFGPARYAFGTRGDVSRLRIFHDGATDRFVYELFAKDGTLNPDGGTGLFLSTKALPGATFDHPITLSLDANIKEFRATYDSPEAERTGIVFAHFFSGFTLHFHDPATQSTKALFMQIDFANSRGQRPAYRGCYGDEGHMHMLYSHRLASDPWLPLQTTGGQPRSLQYDVSRHLCEVVVAQFQCRPSNASAYQYQLPASARDFRNWELQAVYVGLETNNRDARQRASTADPRGSVALGVQLSNLLVLRDTSHDFSDRQCP